MKIKQNEATDISSWVALLDGSSMWTSGTMYVRLYDPDADKFWDSDSGGSWQTEGSVVAWPTATSEGHAIFSFTVPAGATSGLSLGKKLFFHLDDNDTPGSVTQIGPLLILEIVEDLAAIAGDAMDLVTDAIDSDAVATTGANEIRDAILDDATRFSGADIDAAISSRAVAGDAMDLITDAVDSDAVATTGANEIRDAILDDATRFSGADIDAAISSRAVAGDAMDLVADAVDSTSLAASAVEKISAGDFEGGAVWIDTTNGSPTGLGTKGDPVDSESAAYTVATAQQLRSYMLRGVMLLGRAYTEWGFRALDPTGDIISFNGQNVSGCRFETCGLLGTQAQAGATNYFKSCVIGGTPSGLAGEFHDCAIQSPIALANQYSYFHNCSFHNVTPNGAQLDCTALTGSFSVQLANCSGSVLVKEYSATGDNRLVLSGGTLTLDSTCDNGDFFVEGGCLLTDNSTGSANVVDNRNNKQITVGGWLEFVNALTGSTKRELTEDGGGLLKLYDSSDVLLGTYETYDSAGNRTNNPALIVRVEPV